MGGELMMVKFSTPQALVVPTLLASPLYSTRQRHVPSSLAMKLVFVVLYVPLPLTLTVWVYAATRPAQVASVGLKSLKVMVPPALPVAPLIVAKSLGMRLWAVLIAGLFGLTTSVSL